MRQSFLRRYEKYIRAEGSSAFWYLCWSNVTYLLTAYSRPTQSVTRSSQTFRCAESFRPEQWMCHGHS